MNIKNHTLSKLKGLAAAQEAYSYFFEDLAGRQRNYTKTSIDTAMKISGASRQAVIELFKELEGLGFGAYVVGRRGSKTRFEWTVSMIHVGKAAIGESDDDSDIDPLNTLPPEDTEDADLPEEEDVSNGVLHPIKLRPDFTTNITLPSDFTQAEAARLCKIIMALPF